MRFFLAPVLLIFSRVINAQLEEIVAVLPQGKLVGVKLFTAECFRPYLAFSNIPYAKPPLGNLRFKPPQDPPTWRGVRVLKFPPVCHQWVRMFETSNFFGQEDCLYINVFTPVIPLNDQAKLPVLVCIHGGDFQRGSSYECPANNFMEKDVVFVSFNYRLGIFGFLSIGDKILPGNYGLKDQVAALKWVRKNIESFGGDPDRVTIMGSGAGGASVHYHMYSPLSKGLFHFAISQSGSALIPWAFTPPDVARNRTIAAANLMKCPNDTTGEIYMCLSKVQSKVLAEMQPKLTTWFSEPNVVFTPTVEPVAIEKAFLSKNPWRESEENAVPWIIGFNSGEGALKSSVYFGREEFLLEKFNNETDQALPAILTYDVSAKPGDIPTITKKIKKFYFNNEPVTSESASGLIDLFTDSMVACGCMKAATRYSSTRYFYLYDHVNKKSFGEFLTAIKGYEKYKMASHSDELISLFYVPWSYADKESIENDVSVSRRMLKFWMNFVETGNPNGKSNQTVWKPMRSEKFEYLRIATTVDQMESNLLTNRYRFWENLPITARTDTMDVEFTSSTNRDEL